MLYNWASNYFETHRNRKREKFSLKLKREVVYEKIAAKYKGVSRFAHKLRQFHKFYLTAGFFLIAPLVIFFCLSSLRFNQLKYSFF